MNLTFVLLALAAGLCAGMLVLMEYGRRLGRKRLERDPESARAGVAAADGAVFALLGLMIAFTFSGAATRFDTRRELITSETNAVGTAWLRLDLLPADVQPAAREAMRRYVDARLAVYDTLSEPAAAKPAVERVSTAQAELWRLAIAARGGTEAGWDKLLLPALNEMFDIGTTRTHVLRRHPPAIVFVLLCTLALGCALLAGFAMAAATYRPTVHMFAFAFVVAVTVYVVLDFELPRQGLFRVDDDDQALIDVRAGMR